jgi:hypothetical protein
MGVFKPFSSCDNTSHSRNSWDGATQTEYVYADRISNNPDPTCFVIKKTEQVDRFLIAEVHYPNCQNYEGNKIVVFEGVPEKVLREQTSLDPHFCDSPNHPSPVARFEPTARGWNYALVFCQKV